MNAIESVPTGFDEVTQRRELLQDQIEQLVDIAFADLDAKRPDLEDADCMLCALEEDLAELAETKRRQNFYEEVIEQLPHWEYKVTHLREDQAALLEDAKKLRSALSDRGHLRRLQRHLRGWLARFREIDRRESRLVQDACNVDVGGEG